MAQLTDSRDVIRSRGAALALSEIECLANEMAGLMRMGVPLAQGLRELAPAMKGNLRGFVNKLVKKLESGQDLSAALHEERSQLPSFFQAVVDAGIRSGDPSIALKSLAETARRIDEHRRTELHALTYPLLVGLAAIGLMALSLLNILPWHLKLYTTEGADPPRLLLIAGAFADGLRSYWWLVPLMGAAIFLVVWVRPVGWRSTKSSAGWLGIGWLPTQRNIVACSRWSMMLDVLVLLLKRRTPLHESLVLAASVALPRAMQKRVELVAENLSEGRRLTDADFVKAGFPRAIASALGTPRKAGGLIQVLGQLESEYRWRTHDLRRRFSGPWVNTISVTVAGGFVLAYILVIVFPIVQVYYDIVNNRIN